MTENLFETLPSVSRLKLMLEDSIAETDVMIIMREIAASSSRIFSRMLAGKDDE